MSLGFNKKKYIEHVVHTHTQILSHIVISRDNKSSKLDLNNSNESDDIFCGRILLTLRIFSQSFFSPTRFYLQRSPYVTLSTFPTFKFICSDQVWPVVRVEYTIWLWNIVNIKLICTKTRKTFSPSLSHTFNRQKMLLYVIRSKNRTHTHTHFSQIIQCSMIR